VSLVTIDVTPGGGKYLVVSGAPRSFGDPVDRSFDAVLDLRERCGDPVMIGINHGMTFYGDIGGADRRVYAVIGDSINVAARVMAKAPPGRTWCTEATAGISRSMYRTEAVAPFTAKGKSEPVRAVELVGRDDSRSVDGRPSPGTVCRTREIEELRAALDAMSDRSAVVRIVAPPGVGRSALLDEFRRDVAPSPVVSLTPAEWRAGYPKAS